MAGGFRSRWFKHRVAGLLHVLHAVAWWSAVVRVREQRPVDWSEPHRVVVCPLVSPSADAARVAAPLAESPARIERWAAEQFRSWTGRQAVPIDVEILPAIQVSHDPPPLPGPEAGWWTRQRATSRLLRYLDDQARRFPPRERGDTRIWLSIGRESGEERLSVGTRRDRMGVVFASDDPAEWGNVACVLVHEALHAVGARDHREPDQTISNPEGYADPSATPLLPQSKAEIMALGIPATATEEWRVESLDDVVMGGWTAREIGWR